MRHLIAALILLTASPADADEVVVFAAASLKTALDQVAEGFQAQTGARVRISYAGSNALARQIIDGAPADVFVSAAEDWMDVVEAAGVLAPGTRRDLLGNDLVLVTPDARHADLSSPGALADALGDGRLAMAMVDAVPAGRYGKQALVRLGLWDRVAGRVAQTDNVRAALALVAAGEAAGGIVYASDAAAEPRVHVAATFPDGTHDPIVYPAALTAGSADAADRAFLDALSGPEATAIFAAQGFRVLPR